MFKQQTLEGQVGGVGAADDVAAAVSAVGLSTCHISPKVHYREAGVTVAIGGNVIRLRGPELPGDTLRAKANRHRATPRGTIKTFSSRSRHRLLEKLGTVDQRLLPERPLMVTLTYPDNWPTSPEQWKRDLQNFAKRVLRIHPRAAIVWRMEAQQRGAPHFHLLVFNVRFLPHQWVGSKWAMITNGNAAACSQVQPVRSWRGVMSYASKYLAKLGDDRQFLAGNGGEVLEEVGRLWGIINSQALPADVRTIALTIEQFYRIRRNLERHKASILRRAGLPITRIRDATRGTSRFLDWPTAVQLVNLETGDLPLYPLLRASMKLQERIRWQREAEDDYRASQPQRAKRGLTVESPIPAAKTS